MRKRRDAASNPLFKELNLLKLEDISNVCLSVFVFKSLNNMIDNSIQFLVREAGPYNLRNVPPLMVPLVRDRRSELFIPIRGAVLWNSLPASIRSAQSIHNLKKKLKIHYISNYENT